MAKHGLDFMTQDELIEEVGQFRKELEGDGAPGTDAAALAILRAVLKLPSKH
jgi:hypothetical protein